MNYFPKMKYNQRKTKKTKKRDFRNSDEIPGIGRTLILDMAKKRDQTLGKG